MVDGEHESVCPEASRSGKPGPRPMGPLAPDPCRRRPYHRYRDGQGGAPDPGMGPGQQ